jgi:hypothetical protein
MFKNLDRIKEKYEAIIYDYSLKDYSGNMVMFTYEIDFGSGLKGILIADYYMLSVETFLKITSDKEIPINEIKCIISDIDDLRTEIKKYFDNLRNKA